MNTNWSSPKRNIITALLSLRKAILAGFRARLIRLRNEDCDYPILIKKNDEDFRNFEFQIGYAASRNTIAQRDDLTAFQKYLSLNYVNLYGTEEAVERYYSTGRLSKENNQGIGRSHLVAASDLIRFMLVAGERDRAQKYIRQYETDGYDDVQHWFDFYRYKHGSQWAVRKFWRKLWVVELLKTEPLKS